MHANLANLRPFSNSKTSKKGEPYNKQRPNPSATQRRTCVAASRAQCYSLFMYSTYCRLFYLKLRVVYGSFWPWYGQIIISWIWKRVILLVISLILSIQKCISIKGSWCYFGISSHPRKGLEVFPSSRGYYSLRNSERRQSLYAMWLGKLVLLFSC